MTPEEQREFRKNIVVATLCIAFVLAVVLVALRL